MTELKEGFWRQNGEYNSPLPQPIPRAKPWKGQRAFVKAFKAIPVKITNRYRGWSTCRICKMQLGSCDTLVAGYTVPEQYLHYVTEHNVKPSQGFIDAVMLNDTKRKLKITRKDIVKMHEFMKVLKTVVREARGAIQEYESENP